MKRKIVLLMMSFLFLGAFSSLKAQVANGDEFTKTVCDIKANKVVDLGKDVAGAELNEDGGVWHFVENTVTGSNLASYTGESDSRYIEPASNIFSLVGESLGEYTFVYTATNNACLPAAGSKVVVKLTIAETAKPISRKISLCASDAYTLKLSDIISPTLTGVTFDVTNAVNLPTASLSGTNSDEMVITPTFKGVFSLDYKTSNAPCDAYATITVDVVREGIDKFKFDNDSITYCNSTMPDAINLTYLAGTSATDGEWSTTASSATVATVATNGDVTFSALTVGRYVFDYTYKDCEAISQTKNFIIVLTDDLSGPSIVKGTDDVCKSVNPIRIYNLMSDGFGINVPNNAGTWTSIDPLPHGASRPEVGNGQFSIAKAKVGTYKFEYKFSNANDPTALCNAVNLGTKELTLTVGDGSGGSALDGRVQLCYDDVKDNSTTNFDLNDFIVTGAGVSNLAWTDPAGVALTGSTVTYGDLSSLGAGVHKFEFTYESAGCDAADIDAGYLYVDITSELDMGDVTIRYCRPDMPSELNLNQLIGVNVPGAWSKETSSGGTLTANKFVEGAASGSKTYVLTFTPSSSCGVTAVVTLMVADTDYN